ncbi:MAG: SDR family oxidoreductase [Verrucomicrobiae bacterium]|nr:SDR family oxidoreductase [Verrucomicrobiae bacterium]
MEPSASPVWITGAGGLIGSHLARLAGQILPGRPVVPLRHSDLELEDSAAVAARFGRERPGLVLHCAALSRSPACQSDPAMARRLNVEVTRTLAGLSPEPLLVFFSTDLVFDGKPNGGYREDDPPHPLMIYAGTKLEAEAVVRRHPHHLIIRTSLNAGPSPAGNRGFDEDLRNAWRAGRTVALFQDEIRSPIAAAETARAVLELARAGARGTVHVAGSERLSRYDLGALLAARHPELSPRIEKTWVREFRGAPRPTDISLDVSLAERLLGHPLPRFSDWLASQPG